MSSIQRITGTNSGLDVDTLVKTALKGDQSKIDKEVQNQKVMQYQQDQYKQIMSDASNFYDKYFDVLKSGSMMSTSTYQTETFTSSDGTKVTAKGLAGAKLDNYTISVTQLASKATDNLTSGETGNVKISIGTASVKFLASADGNTTVKNYNDAVAAEKTRLTNEIKATTDATIKANSQKQLDDLNNNVITAQYSEFSKNVSFTASSFGGTGFTLSRIDSNGAVTATHSKAEDKYLEATIKNSSGTVYTISSSDKKTSNSVTIDNVQFDFKAVGASTSTTATTNLLSPVSALKPEDTGIGGDISPLTELTALAEDSTTTTTLAADGGKTTETKSADGTRITKRVTDSLGNTTTITTDTTKPQITSVIDKNGIITTTDTSESGSGSGYTLKTVKAGTTTTTTKTNDDGTIPITKTIETSGATRTTTTTLNDNSKITVRKKVEDVTDPANPTTSAITTVTSKNEVSTTTVSEANEDAAGNSTINKTTQIKVDTNGLTTKTVLIGGDTNQTVTTYNSPTTLTGSTDVSALKDKIVKFVDDYNTLLSSINTKIFETRDKDYMPLTDEQKAAMTDSQITAWEKKAQTGLLRKDSDLQRIVSEMKSAISTVVSGSGLSLEKIGITPVKDYTDKNGMLTVNEDKLTQALEDNGGDVKDLFIRAASPTDSGGALTQLKSALYSEFKTSTSSLSQKAGLVGSSTEFDNTLTKSIYKKKQLIADLNSSLTDKENALYKKYSNLETAMENINAQKSSLASMLGTS